MYVSVENLEGKVEMCFIIKKYFEINNIIISFTTSIIASLT